MHFDHPNIDSYRLNKPNVCILALLKDKLITDAKEAYLVVNCHILYNCGRGDIKLVQIMLIIKAINLIIEEIDDSWNVNIIFAGDFNSCPNSPIYEVLTQGNLEWLTQHKKKWSGQERGIMVLRNELDPSCPERAFQKLNNKFGMKYSGGNEDQTWKDLVESIKLNIGEDGELTPEFIDPNSCDKKTVEELLNNIRLKSAYSECLRSCFWDKEAYKRIEDINMIERNKRWSTYEPYMTSMGEFPNMITVDFVL